MFLFLSITIDATNNIILMLNATSVVISVTNTITLTSQIIILITEMMTRQISHG